MPVFQVIGLLIVIGVLLYLFRRYVTKIDPVIKQIIIWFVIVLVVLWLLNLFGVITWLMSYRI